MQIIHRIDVKMKSDFCLDGSQANFKSNIQIIWKNDP